MNALALIKSGSDFVEVAKLFSDSENKGEVAGPFKTRDVEPDKAINPVLEKTLLSLKVGDVTGPIQTKYGYEILKLETLNPARAKELDEVIATVSYAVRNEKRQQWEKDFLEKYWKEAVTEYHPELIDKEIAGATESVSDASAVLAMVYGETIALGDYRILRGRDKGRQAGETEEQYKARETEQLKNSIIFRFVAAKHARDLGYESIPRYQIMIQAIETQNVFSIWWTRMMNQYLKEHPVTEEDKKAYYDANSQNFMEPPTAHVAEMTFTIPPYDQKVMYEAYKADQKAAQKAMNAIARLMSGEKFADVAKEISESPTAKNGGDLGIIAAESDRLPYPVIQEALNLKVGDISKEPIKNATAYYVVTTYEKPERKALDFKDPKVQERVARGALTKKRQDYFMEILNQMVDPGKINRVYKDFYTFNSRYMTFPSLDVPKKD